MLIINNRDQLAWQAGMTVQDVLEAMGFSYALITVTVNGTLVEKDDWAHHRVPDGAAVGVFHLAHGG